MGSSAPPNRLERAGSSLYLVDSIGISSLSVCLDRSSPRTCRVFLFKSPCIELLRVRCNSWVLNIYIII